INEFGDEDDVVVVVEGKNRGSVIPVLDELSEAIKRQDHLFHAVFHKVDRSKLRGKGLHYLKPTDLAGIERFLDKVEPIVRGQWTRLNVSNMAAGMCRQLEHIRQLKSRATASERAALERAEAACEEEIARLSGSLLTSIDGQGPYRSPWPEMPSLVATLSERNCEYELANEGRLGLVALRLVKENDESFAHGSEAIDALRQLIAGVNASHPHVKIGLTGLPVMENDEMRISQVSMMEASLLSLLGVACLFVAGFGGLRHPILTVAALLLALGWSFGYITYAVGHLNILSISFCVILIGLGIDFGVHYTARYLQLYSISRSSSKALEHTASTVGPGIVTGAVTTSIAFFMAGLTEFTGVAELGVISGGGILLCCLAAIVVLPAMIYLSDRNHSTRKLPAPLDIHEWMRPLLGKPGLLFAITLTGTIVVSLGMGRLWYDHNLLNLQPKGLESVEWERKLLTQGDQSVWFALSIADSREELLARKQSFLKKPSVERVVDIISKLPVDDQRKRHSIQRIYARLADLPERPPQIPVAPPDDLGKLLARVQTTLGDSDPADQARYQLDQVRDALRRMPSDKCYDWLSSYQNCMAGDLVTRLHSLRAIANPEPPSLADLPEGLVSRFVAPISGRYLLKIFSKADIWDMEAMEKFVADVRDVDPEATGNPLQTYEASRQMKRSYEQAAWYALAAILGVLYIDFSGLRYSLLLSGLWYTLLALVPMGLGMLQTFGVMGLLNIPLNPANMIVLPLILGIGVDDGVHVVHDFRRQKGRYRMSPSTASAVLITSLTTMVGFGSLMIASHCGLQSLGRVLTIGVSCCLFSSLVMLPAILAWLTRNRPETAEDEHLPGKSPEHTKIHRRDPAHHPGTSKHAVPRQGRAHEPAVRTR
ncbi:MAG: MMPL family transporter, partial [Thermoguttaceae bacterium]